MRSRGEHVCGGEKCGWRAGWHDAVLLLMVMAGPLSEVWSDRREMAGLLSVVWSGRREMAGRTQNRGHKIRL